MKKNYLFIAAALMSLTATAAQPTIVGNGIEMSKISVEDIAINAPVTHVQKVKAQAPATRDDLLGFKFMPYTQWMFSSEDPYAGKASAVFKAGESSSEILIDGIISGQASAIQAFADFTKGTVTIKAQSLGYYEAAGANQVLEIMKANMETEKWEDCSEAVGVITEEGVISFSTDAYGIYAIMFMNPDKEGYGWGGMGNFYFEPAAFYAPDLAEWTSKGKAVFTDGWVVPAFDADPIPEEIEVFQKNDTPNMFALRNPYASEVWADVNTPAAGGTTNGWIVIDATYPECVCVRPLVRSGMWLDLGYDTPQELFMFNQSGYKYYQQDITPEEQADEYWAIGENPAEYLSFIQDGYITIRDLYFGISDSPLSMFGWKDQATGDFVDSRSYVQLPEGAGAVKTIEFDENAPVKYFNLQGIEVANPVKGQIVIKTQGNKAQKVVVK